MQASEAASAAPEALRAAREVGVATQVTDATTGWAALVPVVARGRDAAAFLHSQITNDVEGLAPGQGNWSAGVTRTGHLVAAFSVHRLPDPTDDAQAFLLLLPREDRDRLVENLDGFIFADDVTLEHIDRSVALVWGPAAEAVATALDAPLEPGALRVADEGWLIARGLTGDAGLIAIGTAALVDRTLAAAAEAGLTDPGPEAASALVDALRIEAGWIRRAVDIPKKRLLPETGLEQQAVSYTKGCYLGQEVIARVRTYGSVPRALRALILDGRDLEGLPPIGDKLTLDDGTRVGDAASRAYSPVLDGPVMLAFVGRKHRTPGQQLTLRTPGGLRTARVALLPLHQAADRDTRVQQLYDRAIRTFAEGSPDNALGSLEQALRLDPGFADGYEAIGVILGRSGRYHEAIDFFKRLEEVVPGEPLVNTNLSLYYMKLGDKTTAETEAAKAANKSMARGADDEAGTSAAEIAQAQDEARREDAARKEGMFRQVLDFDPEDPVAWFGLGKSLSTLERWDEAAHALARACEVDAKNAAAFLAHGKALEHVGRDTEALEVYRTGMEVASQRGDLMPLKEMESRVLLLGGATAG